MEETKRHSFSHVKTKETGSFPSKTDRPKTAASYKRTEDKTRHVPAAHVGSKKSASDDPPCESPTEPPHEENGCFPCLAFVIAFTVMAAAWKIGNIYSGIFAGIISVFGLACAAAALKDKKIYGALGCLTYTADLIVAAVLWAVWNIYWGLLAGFILLALGGCISDYDSLKKGKT
ncbi:MAG: hypothetical protein Q4G69_09645 [Planctomycetia bacterium]|nr:hypothetical protein [Planctomycetia bacterium]